RVDNSALLQDAAKPRQGIAAAGKLDLVGRTVPPVVVVAGVGEQTAHVRVDQGRPTTRASSLDGRSRHVVHRERIGPVDAHPGQVVRGGSVGYGRHRHLL